MSNLALMAAPALGGFIIDRAIDLVGLVPGLALLVAWWLGVTDQSKPVQTGRS
jgi:hypothetical protein